MTIPLDVMPSARAPVGAPLKRVGLATRFLWSVRREFWESRSLYLAPLSAAVVFLIGFAVSAFGLREQMQTIASLGAIQQRELLVQPYELVEGLLMLAGIIVSAVYCLDALYGERRDRSVLLWKSLPVSDRVTVLAKASIPIIVQPIITFVVTVVTQSLMQLLSAVVLAGTEYSVAPIWVQFPLFSNSGTLFFHLLGVHGLASAPFFGWLLVISAWAPRAPFVWALVPPIVIGFLELIALNTSRFFDLLKNRLVVGVGTGQMQGNELMEPMTQTNLANFLTASGLWIGLAVTAVFLAAAVRLRRAGRLL